MLVDLDERAVDHQDAKVKLSFERCEQLREDAPVRPSSEALIHGDPLAVALREIPPWCAGPGDPQDAFDGRAMAVLVGPAAAAQRRQQGRYSLPLLVGQCLPRHGSDSTNCRSLHVAELLFDPDLS